MNIVLDSNILMSIIISQKGKTSQQFQLLSLKHNLHIHCATLEELAKHHLKLMKSSKSTESELEVSIKLLLDKLKVVNYVDIPNEIQDVAFLLVYGIDQDDAAFVAATIYLGAILWSGDKPLNKGLKARGFANIFDSTEIEILLQ